MNSQKKKCSLSVQIKTLWFLHGYRHLGGYVWGCLEKSGVYRPHRGVNNSWLYTYQTKTICKCKVQLTSAPQNEHIENNPINVIKHKTRGR